MTTLKPLPLTCGHDANQVCLLHGGICAGMTTVKHSCVVCDTVRDVMPEKSFVALCAACCDKYPRIKGDSEIDSYSLARWGCIVCDGDVDPAGFGYGAKAQQADARWFNRVDD